MTAGGKQVGLLVGASLWAMLHAQVAAAAEVAEGTAADAAAQVGAPAQPPARSQRLNPTNRAIALTVPAKDGANYLGDMPLTIGADDSLTFPADRALQLLSTIVAGDVLDALRGGFAGKTAVGPADFAASGIQIQYDPRTLELQFVIPVEKRASRSLSVSALDRTMIGSLAQPQDFSAYLNIRGSVDLVEDGIDTGFDDPVFLLDGAVRVGGAVFESDAIWTPGSSFGPDFQRLGSRMVVDDLKDLMRLTVGDLEVQSRGFQAAPDIAGISVGRSYSTLNPQQIIRPRGDRQFRLDRASTVEVIINGQQVRRLQLAPGNYNLRDFPFAQGANDIRLNVLDDTGRTEVLRFNVFLDQTQLAKGLTEFGIYAGVKAPLGIRGPDYTGELIFSGFFRHGVSDYLTFGVNFQADKISQMAGVEAVMGTALGTFGAQAAFSHNKNNGEGYALQGTFQRLIQRSNGQADTFNLFVEHRSKNFGPVSFFLPNNPYKYELGGGYSHAFNADFYAGFDGRFSKGRGVPDVQSYRVSGGYRLSPMASLTAEGRYEKDSRGEEVSGFVTLTVRLGRFSSARAEYDTRDNRMRASYQTFHGSGVGSYNVSADVERSDLGAGINVNANYFTNRAELGLSHYGNYSRGFGNSLNQRTNFRLGTSLALAGDTLSIGRPIYDSFAIVKPHSALKGADVVVEPTPFGFTANSGALGAGTVPGLSSYAERTISVDVANAKPGTDVGQGSFKLFPPYRSGYLLEVGSDYNVTALGTMLNADGQPVALVSGTARQVAKPDHPGVTVFTNRVGRFGATGLAPGQWRIEMLDAAKTVYVIDIPAESQGIVRLGEITPTKER